MASSDDKPNMNVNVNVNVNANENRLRADVLLKKKFANGALTGCDGRRRRVRLFASPLEIGVRMRGPSRLPMALGLSGASVLLLMLLSAAMVAAACLLSNAAAGPGNDGSDTSKLHTGREMYQAACVACHGPDGNG